MLIPVVRNKTFFKVLGRLVDEGYLARAEGRRFAPTKKLFSYPVLGDVRAGLPQPVEQPTEPDLMSVEDSTFSTSRTRSRMRS